MFCTQRAGYEVYIMQLPEASVQVMLPTPSFQSGAPRRARARLHAGMPRVLPRLLVTAHATRRRAQACHSRNVHGRTLEEVQAVAARWEHVPPSMPQLDGAAWLRGGGKGQVGLSFFYFPLSMPNPHGRGWTALHDRRKGTLKSLEACHGTLSCYA